MSKKKTKERAELVEAIERGACGPLFGQCDSPIFRMVVGSFFAPCTLGEWQERIDKKADAILKEQGKRQCARGAGR